jgi:hypothetical protein
MDEANYGFAAGRADGGGAWRARRGDALIPDSDFPILG